LWTTFDIYVYALGEAMTAVDAAVAGNWIKLGTAGKDQYNEEGIVIGHPQQITKWRGLGNAATMKVNRTEEDVTIRFQLHDMTAVQYAKVLDDITVTNTSNYQLLSLLRGTSVAHLAMLLRSSEGPYGDSYACQYECFDVVQTGGPDITFAKSAPAGIPLEFTVIYNSTYPTYCVFKARDGA